MPGPLQKRSIECPGCGGHTELVNRFVKLVVCTYCDQSISLTGEGAVALGKAAPLADLFTDLSIGAHGTLAGTAFSVQGRARFEYSNGFWDEWYVVLEDGTEGWLHEDEGELAWLVEREVKVASLNAAQVGERFAIDGRQVYVKEKRSAKVFGAEGQLPRGLVQGQTLDYVDATDQGELFMLEEVGGQLQLLVGRRLDDDAVSVD